MTNISKDFRLNSEPCQNLKMMCLSSTDCTVKQVWVKWVQLFTVLFTKWFLLSFTVKMLFADETVVTPIRRGKSYRIRLKLRNKVWCVWCVACNYIKESLCCTALNYFAATRRTKGEKAVYFARLFFASKIPDTLHHCNDLPMLNTWLHTPFIPATLISCLICTFVLCNGDRKTT